MIRFTEAMDRARWGALAIIAALVSAFIAQRVVGSLPAGGLSAPDFDGNAAAMRTLSVTTAVAALAMLTTVTIAEVTFAGMVKARRKVTLVLGIATSALLIVLCTLILSVTEIPWSGALSRAFTPDEVRGFAAIGLAVYAAGLYASTWLISVYLILVGVTVSSRPTRWWAFATAVMGPVILWPSGAMGTRLPAAPLEKAQSGRSCIDASLSEAELGRMKNALRAASVEQPPSSAVRVFYSRLLEPATDSVREATESVDSLRPFGSFTAPRAAVEIRKTGFVADSAGEPWLLIPDASVLSSAAFFNEYCLKRTATDRAHRGSVALAFSPRKHVRKRLDVEGTIYMDSATSVPAEIVFDYPDLSAIRGLYDVLDVNQAQSLIKPRGRITFARTSSGTAVVDHWHVRSPVIRRDEPIRIRANKLVVRKRLFALETGGLLRPPH